MHNAAADAIGMEKKWIDREDSAVDKWKTRKKQVQESDIAIHILLRKCVGGAALSCRPRMFGIFWVSPYPSFGLVRGSRGFPMTSSTVLAFKATLHGDQAVKHSMDTGTCVCSASE